jgi:hypothetical protein
MGLLEDAIREHLELKRLRGADPTEVAREQHEALDPPAGQPTAPGEDHAPAGEPPTDAGGHALDGDASATADHADDVPKAPVASDPSPTAQETAELDMQEVLANDPSAASEGANRAASNLADGGEALEAEEEALEWEVPARAPRDPEQPEGESSDAAAQTSDEDESRPESAEDPQHGDPGAHHDDSRQGRLSL